MFIKKNKYGISNPMGESLTEVMVHFIPDIKTIHLYADEEEHGNIIF